MNLRTDAGWTRPYFGVSHRYINDQQCTVTEYTRMATATVFGRRGSGSVFAGAVDAPSAFATAADARAWCEQTAGL